MSSRVCPLLHDATTADVPAESVCCLWDAVKAGGGAGGCAVPLSRRPPRKFAANISGAGLLHPFLHADSGQNEHHFRKRLTKLRVRVLTSISVKAWVAVGRVFPAR